MTKDLLTDPFAAPAEPTPEILNLILTPEQIDDVEKALHCADSGDATHWPTVASILADEVRRLRTVAGRALASMEMRQHLRQTEKMMQELEKPE